MAAEIIRDLWVCADCLMFHANGPDNLEPEIVEAIVAGCEREAPYHWTPDGRSTRDCGGGIPCDRCEGSGTAHPDDWEPEDGRDVQPPACEACAGSGRLDEPEGADEQEFSWRPCACCRSSLGGSRHRFALIKHT